MALVSDEVLRDGNVLSQEGTIDGGRATVIVSGEDVVVATLAKVREILGADAGDITHYAVVAFATVTDDEGQEVLAGMATASDLPPAALCGALTHVVENTGNVRLIPVPKSLADMLGGLGDEHVPALAPQRQRPAPQDDDREMPGQYL